MALKLNNPARSAIVNAVKDQLAGASLKVYDGTQPDTGGGSAGSAVLLVTISSLYWASASNGTSSLAGTSGSVGTAATAGTATWARLSTGTDATALVIDGVCGTSVSANFVIDSKVISALAAVILTKADIVQPDS